VCKYLCSQDPIQLHEYTKRLYEVAYHWKIWILSFEKNHRFDIGWISHMESKSEFQLVEFQCYKGILVLQALKYSLGLPSKVFFMNR
jgi:hypothetical protein